MRKILTTMIRAKVKMWSPFKKKLVNKLERIQRMVTKLVPELELLQYQDRLREINLPTLEQRRAMADLIQIYKFCNKMEETDNENLMLREERSTRYT